MKTICCIGAGNVAWHFTNLWHLAGYKITTVYSRKLKNAKSLAKKLKAKGIDKLSKLDPQADIYFIGVTDDALRSIADTFPLSLKHKPLIIHCSGNVSSNILKELSPNYGVLYPFQSLRKKQKLYSTIPLCITAPNNSIFKEIGLLANCISEQQYNLEDRQRSILQLTGVLSNNFITHLIYQAQKILEESNIDKSLLTPILEHTINSLIEKNAYDSQTGPAIRNDQSTQGKHLELIKSDKELTAIYKSISKSIKKTYHENS